MNSYVNSKAIFLTTVITLFLFAPLAQAEVVVFENYDTTMSYNNGKLQVTKDLRLLNVGTSPIIPGEIHFKVSKDSKDGTTAPEINAFVVTDKFGKELDTRQIVTGNEVDLVFTVWDPLLPDFFYDMKMTYELAFQPKGLLFYQLALPEERTTVPIKSSTTTFELPKKYHLTYYSPDDGEYNSAEKKNAVTWNTKDEFLVEYAVIPFPRLGIKGVNIFWIVIILLFLTNLIFRMRKKIRSARSS